MISGPQGDFKHTGHVGPDGQIFGDIAFLGSKVRDKDNTNPITTRYPYVS